jgi:hypothetical protein
MARRKMQKGKCRICQEDKQLSFEHVPPKSAFNKHTRYISIPQDKYTDISNPLKTPPKGRIHQGGTGYYSFCQECNNLLGRKYVPAYEKWVKIGGTILENHPESLQLYSFTAKNIKPLEILKQIVAMFLAMNDELFLKMYSELSDFVANSQAKSLPDKYRIFLYLNNEGYMRHRSQSFVSSPDLGFVNCTELAFFPFGYVLSIDHKGPINKLAEITGLKRFRISYETDLRFNLFRLPTYIPLSPLDYRSKVEIEQAIEQAQKKKGQL